MGHACSLSEDGRNGGIMTVIGDLLTPSPARQEKLHKMKKLIPGPKSRFVMIKCNQCTAISNVFTHAKTTVFCSDCKSVLATPRGGKCAMQQGAQFKHL